MKLFVTSDHHFLHNRIIEICQRPFKNVDEMNQKMIDNWNDVVDDEDIVYYLGDFAIEKNNKAKAQESLANILNTLKGRKFLVAGNHDELYLNLYRDFFVSIVDYHELMINGRRVIMCHYPIEEWRDRRKGSLHLHGHLHGGDCMKLENRYDVGADTNDFKPYDLDFFLNHKV